MRQRSIGLVAATLLMATIAPGTGALAQRSQQIEGFTATPLAPTGDPVQSPKSPTSKLAATDPKLLKLPGSRRVRVMVKLDYDSVATYAGGIQGLRATSPEVTGLSLKESKASVRRYTRYVGRVERSIRSDIAAAVPSAEISGSFQVAYGGLAMEVPAGRVADLLAVDGVVAVHRDVLANPLTDATPEFLGATDAWDEISGPDTSGEGVIVGVLDTGIWPQHPSFEDPGIDHPGGSFACEFGDGTDPLLGAPFTCNDKLIGAYAFVDTYMAFVGALPGENCNNATGACSARDADGHGTHTASTAAGAPVEAAEIFGIARGDISGMAPGAHVIAYRVCLDQGCFQSDSVAAVEQAITDGVDVINFSISGGNSPFTDPVELAFFDAYAAGILVNASAGNSGPGAATADHAGPWTNTVGASTSNRHWLTTLHLEGDDGSFEAEGASVAPPLEDPAPVILAADIADYDDALCLEPFPAADSAEGMVVVCDGRVSRLQKSLNVLDAGGVGTIVLNDQDNDLFTDNHYTPTVMLPQTERQAVLDFLAADTGVTATWDSGVASPVTGDRMTAFSSRGPLGEWIKPDVTAPGLQILAGTTEDPHDSAIFSGPPGELFQSIAGTSMSSPHSAGVSALVKAAHPDWSPGMIKSALMTSSVQRVLKEDGQTPADPFDRGAGSIRASRAIYPTVVFDVAAADFVSLATNPLTAIHLNLASVNAREMPGQVTTSRTFTNVSGRRQVLRAKTESPDGTSIGVRPRRIALGPGRSRTIQVRIKAVGVPEGQYFGQITLDARSRRATDAVLPVAFFAQQGRVTLEHTCDPTTIERGDTSACEVAAKNLAPVDATVDLSVRARGGLRIGDVSSPGVPSGNGFTFHGTLEQAVAPTVDAITPGGSPGGFVPLADFGVDPNESMGDEGIITFDVPPYLYGAEPYSTVSITSNGYAIVGDDTTVDFVPQEVPDPALPNNVLAPYWSDLNQDQGGETRTAEITDGVSSWIVLEWTDFPSFSDNSLTNSFQIWLQIGDTEGVFFTYATIEGSADDAIVGAENRDGISGVNLGLNVDPPSDSDFTVETSGPTPGGSVAITYDARGRRLGRWPIDARLTSDVTQGVTLERVRIRVT